MRFDRLGPVSVALDHANGDQRWFKAHGERRERLPRPSERLHSVSWRLPGLADGAGHVRLGAAGRHPLVHGRDITWSELVSAIPRIVIALIIGVCLSAPLEIRILKTEIDTELASRQKHERQRLDKLTDQHFEAKKAEFHARIAKNQGRLDDRVKTVEKRRSEILEQRRKLGRVPESSLMGV